MDVVVNPIQDVQQFAKKQTGAMDIYTQDGKQFWAFQSQFLLTKNDFNNIVQDNVSLPQGAKVIHVGVKGYNNGGTITTLKTQAWLQSVDNSYELDYKKGYNKHPNPTDNNLMYTDGVEVNTFSINSTASNPDYITNFEFVKPYIYDGKAVLVTLFQWYDGDSPMHFFTQTTTCEKIVPTVIRTGNQALSSKGVYSWGIHNIFKQGFEANIAPAFILDYYTNDIYGTVNGENARVKLYDVTAQEYLLCDGQAQADANNFCTVNADGTFRYTNLDYTHIYTLTVAGNETTVEKTLNFDGEGNDAPSVEAIKNDVNVNVTL